MAVRKTDDLKFLDLRVGSQRGARLIVLFFGLCILGLLAWMLIMRLYPD